MKDEDSEFDALLSGAGDKSTKKSAKKEVKTFWLISHSFLGFVPK